MDNKEKYINYVVDDLVKDTEMDYYKQSIKFPFPSFFSSLHYNLFISIPLLSTFSKYVEEKYGTRDEEIQIIWEQYRERLKSLIKNG